MVSLPLISNSLFSSPKLYHKTLALPPQPPNLSFWSRNSSNKLTLELGSQILKKNCRGLSVVTRGGTPGTSTYIFAAVFPLSLLVVTIISALKIDDMIEQKFLEELAVNEEIMEAEEGDEERNYLGEKPKPEVSRTRNRPIREVEVSSK